jgi:hypothetical protein
VCVLAHSSGAMLESRLPLPTTADDDKVLGAAITYRRRYLVAPILGVAADDDLDENGQEAGEGEQPAGKVIVAAPAPVVQRKSAAAADKGVGKNTGKAEPGPVAAGQEKATPGEVAHIQRKLDAAEMTYEEACIKAGMDPYPAELANITKTDFATLKAVL